MYFVIMRCYIIKNGNHSCFWPLSLTKIKCEIRNSFFLYEARGASWSFPNIGKFPSRESLQSITMTLFVWFFSNKKSHCFFQSHFNVKAVLQCSMAQFSHQMISGRQEKIKSNYPNMIYFLLSLIWNFFQTLILGLDFTVW